MTYYDFYDHYSKSGHKYFLKSLGLRHTTHQYSQLRLKILKEVQSYRTKRKRRNPQTLKSTFLSEEPPLLQICLCYKYQTIQSFHTEMDPGRVRTLRIQSNGQVTGMNLWIMYRNTSDQGQPVANYYFTSDFRSVQMNLLPHEKKKKKEKKREKNVFLLKVFSSLPKNPEGDGSPRRIKTCLQSRKRLNLFIQEIQSSLKREFVFDSTIDTLLLFLNSTDFFDLHLLF